MLHPPVSKPVYGVSNLPEPPQVSMPSLRTMLRRQQSSLRQKGYDWQAPDAQEVVILWLANLPHGMSADDILAAAADEMSPGYTARLT